MAKLRDAIRMTEAEVDALVAECKSLQVATLDKTGAPHLTTVWFAVHDGVWLFETYGKSQKVVNVRRDPRIALLCERGETYDQLRGVSIQGEAEIIDSGESLAARMKLIVERNHPGLDDAQVTQIAAQMAEKRVVVAVRPTRTISWDHRKLTLG